MIDRGKSKGRGPSGTRGGDIQEADLGIGSTSGEGSLKPARHPAMVNIQDRIDDAKGSQTVRSMCWPDGVQ